MSDAALERIRDVIQQDVGGRGLRTDPDDNLITACAGDFRTACRDLAAQEEAAVAVVTGFFIPHGQPPAAETDGPLGAVFLARALTPLGIKVALTTDAFCVPALAAGLAAAGLRKAVPIVVLPAAEQAGRLSRSDYWDYFRQRAGALTHLIAVERVGPSHTPQSIRAQPGSTDAVSERFLADVPAEGHDCSHTMRGRDITTMMSPAHRLFEAAGRGVTTIGIGDGGNEIGMGRIRWEVIRANIPGGGLVACRTATDHLSVCGVSNWGAYGLAAGVLHLRAARPAADLFDGERERELLRIMVDEGPLVDGVLGKPVVSVDGLSFAQYADILQSLGQVRSQS